MGVDDVKVLAEQRTNYVQKFLDTLSGQDYDDLKRIYTNAKGNVQKTRDFFLASNLCMWTVWLAVELGQCAHQRAKLLGRNLILHCLPTSASTALAYLLPHSPRSPAHPQR